MNSALDVRRVKYNICDRKIDHNKPTLAKNNASKIVYLVFFQQNLFNIVSVVFSDNSALIRPDCDPK